MKKKRNIIIAVVLLVVLLAIPFCHKLSHGEPKTCTVSVSRTSVGETGMPDSEEEWVIPETQVELGKDETVLTALKKAGKPAGVSVEVAGTPAQVVGIGDMQGAQPENWVCLVNGAVLTESEEETPVRNGYKILWTYAEHPEPLPQEES